MHIINVTESIEHIKIKAHQNQQAQNALKGVHSVVRTPSNHRITGGFAPNYRKTKEEKELPLTAYGEKCDALVANQTKTKQYFRLYLLSRSARNEWIEIISGRATLTLLKSRSARNEWIEITHTPDATKRKMSRSARNEWIEIPSNCWYRLALLCLVPQGTSGSKFGDELYAQFVEKSRSARNEWIEISRATKSA